MKVIIDTNIIFSALLREDNKYANTLIKNDDNHDFMAFTSQLLSYSSTKNAL